MKKIINWKLIFIFLIAIISRIILLGQFPGGIHSDEAFAGYEAYSMATYGMDSWGYKNPVYLEVWGSGMSALESYLMIPFIKLWGLNSVTVKLPQVILGIITVFVFYLLLSKITNINIAYWGTFLLAISPWHIMMSRYGMDCNLAPAFILLGIYFGICGLEKEHYLLVSACFWGLALYTYAVNWLFVPLFLFGYYIYCIHYKKIAFKGYFYGSGIIIFSFALPLLLFVAINAGFMVEIKTAFISIPKLVSYRGNEISMKNIPGNLIKLGKLFVTQNDYLLWNSIKGFGIYYLFSTPFILYGGYIIAKKCKNSIKEKSFGYEFVIIWWSIVGLIIGLIQGVGINRMNYVHLAVLILLAVGINVFCEKRKKYCKTLMISIYLISFALFEFVYFGSYQDNISERQNAGADLAIKYALEVCGENEDIYVDNNLRHSQILFYTLYPTPKYIETVEWSKKDSERDVVVQRFGKFCWDWDRECLNEGIYIIPAKKSKKFEQQGYKISYYQSCAVAIK